MMRPFDWAAATRLVGLAVAGPVAGCGGSSADRAAEAPVARVAIVAPAEGDSTGPSVVVRLTATGVRVVPATGLRVALEGHHHVFLDVDPVVPDSVIRTGPGIFHIGSGADSVRLDSLAPGPHRLIAQFAFGDHVPMVTVRADTIFFIVRPSPPR
jgi:hypothetical protein